MGGRSMLVLVGVAVAAGAAVGGSSPSARVIVEPRTPHALDAARVELHSSRGRDVSVLRVRAISPHGKALPVRLSRVRSDLRRGTFSFTVAGLWELVVTDPAGRRVARMRPLLVRVLEPVPTAPPPGFGALGKLGCNPPSPADPAQKGLRDVFGTAIDHEELWALPFVPEGASWARTDKAVFDDLVGKEIKIVFGMTTFHTPFRAAGPDSTFLGPVWGPSFHGGSNWDRQPGTEWGAGFVFPKPGCWRIGVGSYGSLYFLIRS